MTAVQTLHTSNMAYNLININNNNNSNNYVNNNYNNNTCAMIPNILPSIKSETNSPITKKSLKQRNNFGANTGTHHSPHQPASVARRNARERNRVKQVNNGFATLRQHIPSSIIAMSTLKMPNGTSVTTSNRTTNCTNKKLSKVETLRLAVEYIRCLQQLLSDHENDCKNYENHYTNMNEMPDNFIYQDQNNLLQHLKQEQAPTSCLSPAPSYCSSNSSTLSTDGSLGFNYLTSTQSILYQQTNQQQNIENFENYQPASPEDEELLDAITWWQQQ